MMEEIAGYVFRLVCGAIVCGLILAITGTGGPGGKIRTMLCGMFLAVLALSPLTDLDLGDLGFLDPGITARAEELADAGDRAAKEAMAQIIKEQCEAYILNKADELSLTVEADVALDPETGVPASVRIRGLAQPYEREVLIDYIIRTLGIERSGIQWQT